jgi:siroheme synthase
MKGDTPVAMVVDASLKSSETLYSNLIQIQEKGLSKSTDGPGIIYIGESIRISQDLDQKNFVIKEYSSNLEQLITKIE